MTESQRKAREPIMGRADVLLRFLQLISKDRPQDIDQYLREFDDDTERRPLVDQIVDRIIAGDNSLYEKYAQARREAGSRNPYSSPEEPLDQTKQEQALGFFMSKWIRLETALQGITEPNQDPRYRYAIPPSHLIRTLSIPEENKRELERINILRNQAVHGLDTPDEKQLIEAGTFLEQLLQQLLKRFPEEVKEGDQFKKQIGSKPKKKG